MKHLFLSMALVIAASCSVKVDVENDSSTPALPEKVLNVGFLIVDGVYNSELVAPMDVLHHTVFHTDKGMKVFTIGPSLGPITSFEGLRILPDYSYMSDSLPTIDVLIVPSAEHSMDSDLEDDRLINFVRKAGENAQYVMSLCDGAFVLAKAGLVDGHETTTFPGDIARYREMYPELAVHEGVSFVHDGKIITSAGGAKSYDPALYLSEILYGKKAADGIAAGLVIDWELEEVRYIVVNR